MSATRSEVTLDLTREEHRQEALAAVKRGDAVLVASATLGEAVYWVRDERSAKRLKREPGYQGQVIYTLAELRELTGQRVSRNRLLAARPRRARLPA